MKIILINIAILLVVVLFLSAVNNIMVDWSSTNNNSKKFLLFEANGALVKKGENNTSPKNLLKNSGDTANSNDTHANSTIRIIFCSSTTTEATDDE